LASRVLAVTRFAAELREAPGELRGDISAVVAVLRVDPTMAGLAFLVAAESEDEYTVVFAAAEAS
jgi:hypothetical protein